MKHRAGSVLRLATPLKVLAQRFAFLVLVAATFGLMMLGKADVVLVERLRTTVTDSVAPVLDALSRPAATVTHVIDNVRELVQLRSENARLHDENERLLRWQTVARQLESENEKLRRLLNFAPEGAVSFVSGRVIADSGGAFVRSVLLNAGAREGVRKGEAVMTGEGLAGRVTGVGERVSRVLLITDLNSRIPVMVGSGRDRGVLAGDNSDLPELLYLPDDTDIAPGARVVTSGHGGVFPPGLPVGLVTSVGDGGVRVQPYVEWERLEYVRVVDYGLDGVLTRTQGRAAFGGRP